MGFKIDIPTAKDSFRKLAMNPPELPGPSAYFLTMYEYDMENPRYIRTAEGSFRILVNERFLCQLMLECAEEYLKIWIEACSNGDIGVYGAEIKRLLLQEKKFRLMYSTLSDRFNGGYMTTTVVSLTGRWYQVAIGIGGWRDAFLVVTTHDSVPAI